MTKKILMACLAVFLSACGGGDQLPFIAEIQGQTLKYGSKATILIAGKDMRNDMIVQTPTCINPSFSAQSTTEGAVLNCNVTATGDLPIAISSASGTVLYSTTLTVPQPEVTLVTSKGNIVLELNPTATPITVNNFLTYVTNGFYKETLFHRVIAGFVVQGGGYTSGMVRKDGQSDPISLESNKGLSNVRGSLAMARTSEPDSATSEFYINLVDNSSLDYQSPDSPGYAVFGKVVTGMDVVDSIALAPTASTDVPITDVTVSLAFQSK